MTLHSFLELGLDPQILTAIQQKNYQTATHIQAQAIPLVLKGRDLLAQAPTGSGKTAAYVVFWRPKQQGVHSLRYRFQQHTAFSFPW